VCVVHGALLSMCPRVHLPPTIVLPSALGFFFLFFRTVTSSILIGKSCFPALTFSFLTDRDLLLKPFFLLLFFLIYGRISHLTDASFSFIPDGGRVQ